MSRINIRRSDLRYKRREVRSRSGVRAAMKILLKQIEIYSCVVLYSKCLVSRKHPQYSSFLFSRILSTRFDKASLKDFINAYFKCSW